MAMYANRRRPSVSWDTNPTYIRIESRDDSPSTPATPQQALAHNLPQLPRSVARLHSADPRAYQQQSSQVPGVLPVPGQYAHPAGPVYAPFHAQFLAGTAPPHAGPAPGATAYYAAGYGGTGEPAGADDRNGGADYGYPSSAAAPTPSAPLMTNASLPSTPSETPRTQSPAPPPAAPLPGETHAPSEGSWGTPSPEPDEKKKKTKGSRSGLSPYLAEFKLKWDIRDARFESVPRQRWFQEQAFSPGRKTCTVVVQEETEPYVVEVPRRADGRTLTVADVVAALDKWLWEKVGKGAFDEHLRRQDVEAERSYRLGGANDGKDGVFRNVDLFRDDSSYFLGLDEEVVGKNNTSTLLVRAGPAPLV